MNKIDKKLLEDFLNSKCSEAERQVVISWFSDSKLEFQLKSELKKQFYGVLEDDNSGLDVKEINELLSRVHEKIDKLNIVNTTQDKINRFFLLVGKVAAVLFIPLLIAAWLFTSKYYNKPSAGFVEIVAPAAARIHFTLPDGSSGWLNSESTLSYEAGLQGELRKVELKGEGFFNVVKNPQKPFVVKSGKIEVKVLGTKFNVSNYTDDHDVKVTLQSGKVNIYGITSANTKKLIAHLTPGDQVLVSKTNIENVVKTKINDLNGIDAWTDGKLVFEGELMEDVAKKISRWYGVDVVLQGKGLTDSKLHATFQYESLYDVLKLIKLTSMIDYKIIKREKLPDGKYSKERVILFKKND